MSLKGQLKRGMLKTFIAPKMNRIIIKEKLMLEDRATVKSIESSPERFEILYEMLNLDSDDAKLAGFPHTVPIISNSMRDVNKTLVSLQSNHKKQPKINISENELKELEEYARSNGVGSIGYTRVPENLIFKGYSIRYPNAIVFTIEMDKDVLDKAPSHATGVMVHKTYNKLGKISLKITEFLRSKGYNAHSGHPLMGQVLYPPLAEKAGLGYHGKHGMLITPEFGPRVRIAAIYTDIQNLPFNKKNAHDWIKQFCDRCKICFKKCPGKAIKSKDILYGDGLIKTIESQKCFKVFSENHGCSVCMKNCPFNQIGYEKCKSSVYSRLNKLS